MKRKEKRKIIFILIIIFLSLFTGCNNFKHNQNQNNSIIEIKIEHTINQTNLTNKNKLIKNIKIKNTNKKINETKNTKLKINSTKKISSIKNTNYLIKKNKINNKKDKYNNLDNNNNKSLNRTKYDLHENITATLFWIGEGATKENNYISNEPSAWDEKWTQHYGGIDNIKDIINYSPSKFKAKENPFYIAIPYNDLDSQGNRKSNAFNIIPWSKERNYSNSESIIKNRWIKISKDNKYAFGQIEDVGPFGEDDEKYIFSNKPPKNKMNDNAGIDLSPAITLYLNLNGKEKVDWKFVDFSDVEDGPWKNIITNSQLYYGEDYTYIKSTFNPKIRKEEKNLNISNNKSTKNKYIYPYQLTKFKDILNKSKLQAITSSYNKKYGVKYGKFENISHKYFYLESNKYLAFYMCGKLNRSELRFKKDWQVSTNKEKELNVEVKIDNDSLNSKFTFLQIHDDSTLKNISFINKPLLRIAWLKSNKNIQNHIWAIIRLSSNLSEQKYKYFDLGEKPNNFFNVIIKVKNSNLIININENQKVNLDVSYWNKFYNYFKLGVYLQDKGCSKVLFNKIIEK